jgi:hypothetical protein
MTRRDLGQLMTGALAAAATSSQAVASPGPKALAERWRQDFPALRHSKGEERHIYLDSAATAHRGSPS